MRILTSIVLGMAIMSVIFGAIYLSYCICENILISFGFTPEPIQVLGVSLFGPLGIFCLFLIGESFRKPKDWLTPR